MRKEIVLIILGIFSCCIFSFAISPFTTVFIVLVLINALFFLFFLFLKAEDPIKNYMAAGFVFTFLLLLVLNVFTDKITAYFIPIETFITPSLINLSISLIAILSILLIFWGLFETLKGLEKKTIVRVLAILVFTIPLLIVIGLVRKSSLFPALIPSTPTPTQSPPSKDTLAYAVIRTETKSDGTTQDIVDLSINSIGVGQLLLTSPKEMSLGDSGIVRLSITPDSAIGFPSVVSIPTQNTDTAIPAFKFTDRIDIFPIMQADLTGAGFEITSNSSPEKVILSNKVTEWVWTIKPQDEGTHVLLIQVSVPVIIDGYQKDLDTPLQNIPVEIKVTKSLSRKIDDSTPYLIPSLIGFIGVLLGIYANNQAKERERKIAELEKQILEGSVEKQKLNQEVIRLKSISIWQFWRK